MHRHICTEIYTCIDLYAFIEINAQRSMHELECVLANLLASLELDPLDRTSKLSIDLELSIEKHYASSRAYMQACLLLDLELSIAQAYLSKKHIRKR